MQTHVHYDTALPLTERDGSSQMCGEATAVGVTIVTVLAGGRDVTVGVTTGHLDVW